ncbi:MAG: box helicase [Gemmatimonadetes bacterium]|nr:box helicase [Gemmatimonadota bacterium]
MSGKATHDVLRILLRPSHHGGEHESNAAREGADWSGNLACISTWGRVKDPTETPASINDSAVQAMGDDKLKVLAAELITQVKKSVTIDWTLRESARARIKVMVKRILKKYGYRRIFRMKR